MTTSGAVSCGHPLTADAAGSVLRAGGNAFDAIIAAHFMACVAEPVLASPAGGGFLLASPADRDALVYDFFAHTPRQKKPASALDFYPITADFGAAQQEFHIGLGAVAVPGSVHGLFEVHRELGRMPLNQIMEPAITAARDGVTINHLQSYILHVVQPIYQVSAAVREVFGSQLDSTRLKLEGESMYQPELADSLEALAHEGADLFYKGEIGRRLLSQMKDGGQLTGSDLEGYQTIKRKPLSLRYRGARLDINPPPSSGGLLIAFALKLLQGGFSSGCTSGTILCCQRLLRAMELTSQARLEMGEEQEDILDPQYLEAYREKIADRAKFSRGTTHMSVMDAENNVASLTVSNGEGCGHFIPGTGIMPNNMLGEEDLNPGGFNRWAPDVRLSSMMAPAILQTEEGGTIALGSGGSNRIRSAILQVIVNLLDHGMSLEEAVQQPRLHLENGLLSMEPGLDEEVVNLLTQEYPRHRCWDEQNLFFGGVHAVERRGDVFTGSGDSRRGGIASII